MKSEKEKAEAEEHRDERIEKTGQITLQDHAGEQKIHLLTIIGEVEGHENLAGNSKTTKYEHILPQLAAIEDSEEIGGVLVLLNTMGGDVEAGLAIAVSCKYSFIVPTGTMVIHPVRTNGMVIGVPQTFEYFKLIQDRITGFVCQHCRISRQKLEDLMMETGFLTKDVGSILVGEDAVNHGILDEVGGIDRAIRKLREMMDSNIKKDDKPVEK